MTLGPDRSTYTTACGGDVDLTHIADVPWIKLRRTIGVRPMRAPIALEEADPPATRALPPAAVAPPAAAEIPAPAVDAPRNAHRSDYPLPEGASGRWMETARRGPAPIEVSEEAGAPRGVRVPDAPTAAEKEEHYLTHMPFRSWCSYCTRGAAPEDGHRRRQVQEHQRQARPV